MATLTLKQVPEDLYRVLKRRAAANRRSLNGEAIFCLEQVLTPRKLDVDSWLTRARDLRQETEGLILDDDVLRQARTDGRP